MGDNIVFSQEGTHGSKDAMYWDDVSSMEDFELWLSSAVDQIYDESKSGTHSDKFDKLAPSTNAKFYQDYNSIIGGLLLRQWRYGVEECTSTRGAVYSNLVEACYTGDTGQSYLGDEESYGKDSSSPFVFNRRHTCFLQYIDLGRFANHKNESLVKLQALLDGGWLDKQTREVKVELASFNGNVGLFAFQTFDILFERGGRVTLDRDLTAAVVGGQFSGPFDWLRVALEGVFVLWVGVQVAKAALRFKHSPRHFCRGFPLSLNCAKVVSFLLLLAVFCLWGFICVAGTMWVTRCWLKAAFIALH
jgi:hypothetical protein